MKAVYVVVLLLLAHPASAGIFEVTLKLNDSRSAIYVPGTGEVQAAEADSKNYADPAHYYISSHENGILRGLVSLYGSPYSVGLDKSSGSHSIKMKQKTGSSTALVFSRGSWKEIDSRMRDIEKGTFMGHVEPSFAFGLGSGYMLKMVLSYPAIDIVGDMVLQKGSYKLKIENLGVQDGRLRVGIGKG